MIRLAKTARRSFCDRNVFERRSRCQHSLDLLIRKSYGQFCEDQDEIVAEVIAIMDSHARWRDPRLIGDVQRELTRLSELLRGLPQDLDLHQLVFSQLRRHLWSERAANHPQRGLAGQNPNAPKIDGALVGSVFFAGLCYAHGLLLELREVPGLRQQNPWLPRFT